MRFRTKWSVNHPPRYRREQWATTLPLYDGRECPQCGATCCGQGAKWAHQEWHSELDGFLKAIHAAVKVLIEAGERAGHVTRTEAGSAELDEYEADQAAGGAGGEEPMKGYVIGSGAMPVVGDYE